MLYTLEKTHFKLMALIAMCIIANGCLVSQKKTLADAPSVVISGDAVNINSASAKELETLPNVGAAIAKKIVEHRKKFGRFRRAEHLILVSGISDRGFRKMRHLVKIE